MKYNGLGLTKALYWGNKLPFFYQLLRTNIKLAFRAPKKSILYSERLQSGEKFMLSNKTLYPYNYAPEGHNESRSPLITSIFLNNIIGEMEYYDRNKVKLEEKSLNHLEDAILLNLTELNQIIDYNKEEELDLPVAVYANFLYARKMGIKYLPKLTDPVSDDNFYKALRLFEKKIRFSDADSLSQVICALIMNNVCENELWGKIFSRLSEVTFEHEHTMVVNSSPYLFYYQALSKSEIFEIPNMAPFGKATLTYSMLQTAVSNNIQGSQEALKNFSKRIPPDEKKKTELWRRK
jgi:hypothetical protein